MFFGRELSSNGRAFVQSLTDLRSTFHYSIIPVVIFSLILVNVDRAVAQQESEVIKGEVLVKYRNRSNRPGKQLGKRLLGFRGLLKSEAETLLLAAGVRQRVYRAGYFFRPIHDQLLELMAMRNVRESEAHQLIAASLAERLHVASTRYEALSKMAIEQQDPGLARELVLNIPVEMSVSEAVERIWAQKRALWRQGIELLDVSRNILIPASWTPNDTDYSRQYAHRSSRIEDAWQATRGKTSEGERMVIAVIDTGVDYRHPDLSANILRDRQGRLVGYDYYARDNDPMDEQGHGTHCSGIAAAVANNQRGVAGVCPDCLIMPLRVGNRSFSLSAIKSSISFAYQNGADVISMSFGGGLRSSMQQELNLAHRAGVVLVAAAGNDNTRDFFYPAAYPEVISVAAVDENDNRSSFSQFGSWVDVAAPGSRILSTGRNGRYLYSSGTSMAVPYVAGVAALVLSQERVAASDMAGHLRGTVRVVTSLRTKFRSGFGIVNASAAISSEQDDELGVPVIQAPHNVISDRRPNVRWTAVDGATQYDLLIRNRTNGEVVYSRNQIAATSHRITGITLVDGQYCTRVRAANQRATGRYSACKAFTLEQEQSPGIPVVSAPHGRATTQNPVLRWSAASGATRYDIAVVRLSDQRVVYSRTNYRGRTHTVSVPLATGDYCTRVRARTEQVVGDYSSCRAFRIELPQPIGTPRLLAPTGTVRESKPTLEWTAVSGASHYDIWVTRLSDDRVVYRRRNYRGLSLRITRSLDDGQYCAQVRVRKNGALGEPSACRDFTVQQADSLAIPELASPLGTVDTARPTIRWGAVDGASQYDVFVMKLPEREIMFSRRFVNDLSLTSPVALSNGLYCTRVRSRAGSQFGVYGPCERFLVQR